MTDILHLFSTSNLFSNVQISITCYEIYGEKLFDLLNQRNMVKCLEDSKQHVKIVGLTEHTVTTLQQFENLLRTIVSSRSTSSTGANHDSSRSHQVLEISFKPMVTNPVSVLVTNGNRKRVVQQSHVSNSSLPVFQGKVVFVDLAGSEKAADTFQNAKNTRIEGADINSSLLALKEVFRSMEKKNQHTPFRGSKLTQVLKESLQGKSVRTCMIACISPCSSHYEQTLNTLRYATKVYEVGAGSHQNRNSILPVNQSSIPTQQAGVSKEILSVDSNRLNISGLSNEGEFSRALQAVISPSNPKSSTTTHIESKPNGNGAKNISSRPVIVKKTSFPAERIENSAFEFGESLLKNEDVPQTSIIEINDEIDSNQRRNQGQKRDKENNQLNLLELEQRNRIQSKRDRQEKIRRSTTQTEPNSDLSDRLHQYSNVQVSINQTESILKTWNLLSAHKLSIAEMVEVRALLYCSIMLFIVPLFIRL
jgi:kinesin family member 2/24